MTPLLTFLLAAAPAGLGDAPPSQVDYLRDVKPILAQNCVKCHGPDRRRNGLRLDTAAAARKGGDSGPAVTPGDSAKSRLILMVTAADGVKPMPPSGTPLDAAQVAILKAWIDAGAPAPADEVAATSKHWAFQPVVRPAEPAVKNEAWVRNAIDRFVLARLEKEGVAPSSEADRATLIRRLSLDLLGLPPSPKEVDDFVADKAPDAYEKLVDRLLTSPHYGERWGRHWLDQARYADSNGYSIDAPRSMWPYRDWVINAFNTDMPFDRFTIEQLAGDLLPPVADAPGSPNERLIATGFHRNTQINEEGGIDLEQFRVESIVDRVNTTGSVFLGLTVSCCQCHDHKFDALTQREYYELFAFFNSADEPKLELPTQEQTAKREEVQAKIDAVEQRLKELDAVTPEKLAAWEGSLSVEDKKKLPEKVRTVLAIAINGRDAKQQQLVLDAYRNADQVKHIAAALAADPLTAPIHLKTLDARKDLEKQIAELKKDLPVIPTTLIVRERPTPRETHVHIMGDFLRKGALVTPGVPGVLPPLTPNPTPPRGEGGKQNTPLPSGERGKGEGDATRLTRLDLAKWIVDPKNPLTARVTVNRMWMQYFGLGLVETDNDFGTQGTPPSHPELLDWLASEFVARGWSMKAMHKLIVCSATYRQSSKARPDLATLDPRNRLLARLSRLRLDAEIVRDAALTASGLLTPTVGGPSVYPPQPQGVYAFTQVPRDWKASEGPDRYRRGMYTFVWRSAPHPALVVFDAPDGGLTCTRRNRSDTPLQALTLLNDQAFFECAQALAARVMKEGGTGDDDRLAYGFRLCTARLPKEHEREVLAKLLAKEREKYAASPDEAKRLALADLPQGTDAVEFAAWMAVGRVLLNLDETITRE
jgi:mono/diheme cytochrome c family protein